MSFLTQDTKVLSIFSSSFLWDSTYLINLFSLQGCFLLFMKNIGDKRFGWQIYMIFVNRDKPPGRRRMVQ